MSLLLDLSTLVLYPLKLVKIANNITSDPSQVFSDFLVSRLSDPSQQLPNALNRACDRAWAQPDTISTDLQARHRGAQPPHTLPRVMAKLRAAGMPEADVMAAATAVPARILGLEGEVGTLASGACADLTVLAWNEASAPLCDVYGNRRPGGCWEALLTVRAGTIIPAPGYTSEGVRQ